MSRIGKKRVQIPKEAKVTVENNIFYAEGPKGKLSVDIPQAITLDIKDTTIGFERNNDSKKDRAYHGLIRNLVNNALIGVSKGYTKKLDIYGVGFKAQSKGKSINFALGYSHTIDFPIPSGVTVTVPQPTSVVVEGADKVLVGQVAANIRDFFKPEPYKGKGVRYSDEQIRRKQGKVVG
ncbi:MAG: 50S ribosomal protein L6 [Candidatus Omnitrophica bacterium]|nr:50S ribosomal protein L6 [Candidatus Omnitrophota bacterium]